MATPSVTLRTTTAQHQPAVVFAQYYVDNGLAQLHFMPLS
jgi:hypothetical protein